MVRKLWLVAAILIAGFYSNQAVAATTTTTFQVTATVNSSCTVSVPTLAFGTYNPTSSTATTGTTTVSAYCTKGTAFTTAFDAGTTTGGSFAGRLMTDGTDTLAYNLYTDSAHTTVWGDGTSSTSTGSGTGSGPTIATTQTVYGQIAANQNVGAGNYSDTINVTLTY